MLYKTVDGEGILKWKKFCNSLRLRVLLKMLNVAEYDARSEIQKMINTPEMYPVFESNSDAALVEISGVYPQRLLLIGLMILLLIGLVRNFLLTR